MESRAAQIQISALQLSRYSDELLAGRQEFDFRQGQEIFLISIASRPALGSTQFRIQWIPRKIYPVAKLPGHETDYSLLSSAEVKNGEDMPPLPRISSWRGA